MPKVKSCRSMQCGYELIGCCLSGEIELYVSECDAFLVCTQGKEYFEKLKGTKLTLANNGEVTCGDLNCDNKGPDGCELEDIELNCDKMWYLTCLMFSPILD